MSKLHITPAHLICLSFLAIMVMISGCSTPQEMSYVALGDSIPAGWGVGDENYVELFAEYLEQDLGGEVIVHNLGFPGQTTSELLNRLQTNAAWREAVADADVITVWTGWNDLGFPVSQYEKGICGGDENLDCLREKVGQVNESIDATLDEILALNSSDDTRIMIANNVLGSRMVTDWNDNGWFDVLQKEAYESWHDHLVQAAQERGNIVVDTYRGVNGPAGDQANEGVFLSDGLHFNAEGHKLLADLHREAWE